MQEEGTQRDRAAVVVSDDMRTVQSPVDEEIGQHPTLYVEGHPVLSLHRRAAVPRHVPGVDAELGTQRIGERIPQR